MNTKYLGLSLLALYLATPGVVKANALAPPPQPAFGQDHYSDRWDTAPAEYRDAQRRGYHEGVEAARRDFNERRMADADDHESYRH